MLRGLYARCSLVGFVCLILCIVRCVDGLIEIIEEQRCHDYEFRLTCRDLDSHIAILEAWYTSVEDYQLTTYNITPLSLKLKTENDSELDRVYVYSSPKHNGVYVPFSNNTNFVNNSVENNVNNSIDYDSRFSNGSDVMETMDFSFEFVNASDGCGVTTFARSYGSWREGDKRRRTVKRERAINLRAPLSYRCTGLNHCSFILAEDYPPSSKWKPGVVYVKYACFDDTLTIHFCNREVRIGASGEDSEGYIRSPGYPHYYIGDECRWNLVANPEQRIQVTLLDVSLRSIAPYETECTDHITVRDSNGDELLSSSCEQVQLPLKLVSSTNTVEVVIDAGSKGAFPKRGVLLHYKSIGCVTVAAPSDGYLVYRNDAVSHYLCNVNFIFVDTRQRSRFLWCYDDNRWNDSVPLCVEEASLPPTPENELNTERDKKMAHEANMIVDIVIPSLLIAALFIGNAFIVLIIYKYRKRKSDDCEDEFNTIPLSVNGAHSAGNAV